MEDITDADYTHAKSKKTKKIKKSKIENLGEYHDFSLTNNILLLTNVFEDFRKTCLEIHELDPARFISASVLEWKSALKMPKVGLKLLTNIDMWLKMLEKGIREGICHSIHRYAKANDKYMKDYQKKLKNCHVLKLGHK